MDQRTLKLFRFGGLAFIIAGVLFFIRCLFLFSLPNVPSSTSALLNWLADGRFKIALSNELLFFATISLIPALIVLFKLLNESDPIKAIVGCGLLATVIPLFIFLVVIQGRLVYPVYDISLSAESQKLILSIYYGGMHAAFILLGIATILVSFGLKNTSIGQPATYLGFITGVFDFLNAYPWLVGPTIGFVSDCLFAAWFIFIGLRLRSNHVVNY
ncbi:hypothetical protein GO755_28070 [Spirosoma sp. HMF4905]|uniref:DUF4386 domain-containing protein n=1 Tax=Spirosoma arboris TaxID=2682092 RepID=A0A7K1SJH4_9BACT|nr:hypothetical protein [Spirosoma arboris]MVM33925.1 hypothetical protein [Spirosoma arboris]